VFAFKPFFIVLSMCLGVASEGSCTPFVVVELAGVGASCHPEFFFSPVDERVVVFEPVESEEDIVFSSKVDDLEADGFDMPGVVVIHEVHFDFDVFLDISIDAAIGIFDSNGMLGIDGWDVVASYKGCIDATSGAAAIEES